MSEIGAKIKEAAKVVGGLGRLSELSKVPTKTLGNWTSGTSEPKIYGLMDIARVTGTSLDWLCGLSDQGGAGSGLEPTALARIGEAGELLRAQDSLPVSVGSAAEQLASAHADLAAIATNPRLPDRVRAEADLYLRIGFADPEAETRHAERTRRIQGRISELRQRIRDAASGIDLPVVLELEIAGLALKYDLAEDDLRRLVEVLAASWPGRE